jgi:nucleoside-diphosphate-sugar epimerase
MRVFLTGASGHIGSAVVPELLSAGHQVSALGRSDASAEALAAAGAEVLRGDLDDLDALKAGAIGADGVIHLAFKHDWMRTGDFESAVASDLRAVQAIAAALAGSGKPFVGTSGTAMLSLAGITGRPGTEQDALDGGPRVDAENTVIALAQHDVRSSVVRLPPVVHSELDQHGFVPTLIGIARESGVSAYIGDGSNRWPSVHTRDAARLYRLALEAAPAGARLHAVAEEGVTFREIAETIGRQLETPPKSIAAADASEHFGFLGTFVGLDNLTSSSATRQLLGWTPTRPRLVEDLGGGHYYRDHAAVMP